jgi:poly-gamma-glutamate synthesis protein (capsule biosynthesis protein)
MDTRSDLSDRSASALPGGASGPGRPVEQQRRTFGDERDLFTDPGMTPETAAQLAQLREGELSQMKIKGPFTLAVAGDIIGTYPIAALQEPAVRRVLSIISSAEVAFGNMEAKATDYDTATGQFRGLTEPREIAADVKAQGFDMVLRASHQSTTMGMDKMLESNRIIAEAGLVYAGSGRNLQEARSPAYHMTPKGRIGMVGMYAYPAPVHEAPYVTASLGDAAAAEVATYQTGFHCGLPGVNSMRLHQAILVPQEDLAALRKIAMSNSELAKKILAERPLPASRPPRLEVETDPSSPVRLFTTTYALGPRGRKRLTMYKDDERLNLRSIREAKEAADFVITAINSHESAWTIPFDFLQSEPPDFLIELAREAIDNGADAFVGSGVHVLRGIEIYKDRPIFYGLMSYNYEIASTPVAYDRYWDNGLNPFTTEYTETELNWKANHPDPTNMESMESVVGEASFHDGKLTEVRIYPIDFGYGLPMSQKGAPRLSTGEVAQRILTRVQRISKPLGTHIAIQDDIGIITVGADGRSLPEG